MAWRWGWQAAAVVGLIGWGALILDRLFEPPPTLRAMGLAFFLGVGLLWLATIVIPRLLRRIDDRQLLTLLHHERPEEAELIATAIDLRSDPAPPNPKLAAATFDKAERTAEQLREVRLTRPASEYGFAWFAAVALGGAILLGLARTDLASRFIQRVALSQEPWPRRVELIAEGFRYDESTGEWTRPGVRGEPFEFSIVARVAPGGQPPRTVWARGPGRRLTTLTRLGSADAEAIEQRYRRRLERLDEETSYVIRGGDAALRLRLRPVDRPGLTDPRVVCSPPDYLRAESFTTAPATLTPMPEGSLVGFEANATKPLAAVEATLRTEDATPHAVAARLEGKSGRVIVEPLVLENSSVLTVLVTDRDGFVSAPIETPLEARADTPPTVGLELDGVGRAITRDARLPARAPLDDDQGVASVLLRLEVSDGDSPPVAIDLPTPVGLPGVARGVADLLSLRSAAGAGRLRLEPGDRLTVAAEAVDRYDLADRPPSSSTPITLEVVEPAELLARLGEAQRELGSAVESLRTDVERLEYEIDLATRRGQEDEPPESLARWASERGLDARKAAAGVAQAARRAAGIRRQVLNNRLDQPALAERLNSDAAAPLRRVADRDLKRVRQALRAEGEPLTTSRLAEASRAASQAVETLGRVAQSLNSQQTYNEVVALLRGLIREQRVVNERTTRQQNDNARRLLLD
ncbi:hypothetical protein MalM25_09790 [Planctomycetes bacterium MalM25]|nr:hypothetical protein MalM25_09790 [Planctomycetes bacterium MalM25]